jgi:hypothetical protein
MGKYQDFVNIATQSVPDYTTLQIVPRGAPIFPDLLMTGQMRFGRRQGANVAVLNPDNEVKLTTPAQISQIKFNIDRTLKWFEVGALLTFNKTEMMILEDWDPNTNQVQVTEPLTVTWPNGSPLYLWATPLIVQVSASKGDTVLTVRSRYNIVNGDTITIPVSSSINSLTQLTVTISQAGGTYLPDPIYPHVFALSLSGPLPVDMLSEQSKVFLRAYPGYTSTVQSISRFQGNQMGPFLVDYLSTPLDNIQSYAETFAIRTFNAANVPIDGTGVRYVTVEKNTPILSLPIWAEELVFWKVERGTGGFALPNKYRLITDDTGKARVGTNLVPAWQTGNTWNFKVKSPSNGLIRIYTDSFGYQDYNILAFQSKTIQLSTPGPFAFLACDTVQGSSTVTVVSTTNMVTGTAVVGKGIPENSAVLTVLSPTTFQLGTFTSNMITTGSPINATATATVPLAFTPPKIGRIEFLAHLETPGAEVTIADGTITGATVSSIQYTYVFNVLGYTNYQATSLIVKPMFQALSEMYAQYDSEQNYDSGFLYL